MAQSEQTNQFETDVISPAYANPHIIESKLESIIDSLGEVTIFQAPTPTGQSMQTKIGPFDFWEARELNQKAKEKFIKRVLGHIEESPCVVFRQLTSTPADNRKV